MEHFMGCKGYAKLYLIVLLICVLFTNAIAAILLILKVPQAQILSGGLMVVAIFAAGYIVSQRFVKVEGRYARAIEVGQISFDVAKIASLFFVGGYLLVLFLVWVSPSEVMKLLSIKALIIFLMSWLGFMSVSYISLLLNFLATGLAHQIKS